MARRNGDLGGNEENKKVEGGNQPNEGASEGGGKREDFEGEIRGNKKGV